MIKKGGGVSNPPNFERTFELKLTQNDPPDSKEQEANRKATENLLSRFPAQPFKEDFIEGMKIRGRQRPIKDYTKDLKHRMRELGDGIGSAFYDDIDIDAIVQNSDIKSCLSPNEKNKSPINLLLQRERDIEKLHEGASYRDPRVLDITRLKEIMKNA